MASHLHTRAWTQSAAMHAHSQGASRCRLRPALTGPQRCAPRRAAVRVSASGEPPKPKDTLNSLDAVLGKPEQAEAAPETPAAPTRKPGGLSKEQKLKLREEYLGFGGAENTAMPSNYFLNIMLGITAIVLICYFGGILPK